METSLQKVSNLNPVVGSETTEKQESQRFSLWRWIKSKTEKIKKNLEIKNEKRKQKEQEEKEIIQFVCDMTKEENDFYYSCCEEDDDIQKKEKIALMTDEQRNKFYRYQEYRIIMSNRISYFWQQVENRLIGF